MHELDDHGVALCSATSADMTDTAVHAAGRPERRPARRGLHDDQVRPGRELSMNAGSEV